jgi:hypothetical protein
MLRKKFMLYLVLLQVLKKKKPHKTEKEEVKEWTSTAKREKKIDRKE